MGEMDSFSQLCRLRATLESFAAGELFENPHRPKIIAQLKKRLPPMRAAARRGDYEAFHHADMQLHQAMVEAAATPTLTESWQRAAEAVGDGILSVKKTYWPNLMALWREHEFLLEAWASHDPQVVRQATQQHLEVGLYRVKLSQQQTPHEGGATDRAAAFLSTHYASEISIEWVARNIAFISTSQLTRRFQSELGLSPYAWLRQVRMEQAALLLRSGKDTIAAIGKKTGYTNASHFSRDFRSHFGTTPRQYRQSTPS